MTKQRYVGYAIRVCGLPSPADGEWHRLGYVEASEHKCGKCEFQSKFVKRTKSRTTYTCGKHREWIKAAEGA